MIIYIYIYILMGTFLNVRHEIFAGGSDVESELGGHHSGGPVGSRRDRQCIAESKQHIYNQQIDLYYTRRS
jgi:hypothetical protein